VERVNGIEPSYAAWEAAVLPLNYTREGGDFTTVPTIQTRMAAESDVIIVANANLKEM
jgi:hypothetical protein